MGPQGAGPFGYTGRSGTTVRSRPLLGDEAYLYDAYTSSQYRGRGLAVYLRFRLYQELANRGRRTLFSTTERLNPPALRFKEKMGARVVDSGKLIRLFGRWSFSPRAHPERVRVSLPGLGGDRRNPD